jgi:hypothetical protein
MAEKTQRSCLHIRFEVYSMYQTIASSGESTLPVSILSRCSYGKALCSCCAATVYDSCGVATLKLSCGAAVV